MDVKAVLSRTNLFSKLSDSSLDKITRIGTVQTKSKKSQIFGENQVGTRIYFLITGTVQLTKVACDGKSVVVDTIGSGAIFGEVILVGSDRYATTATVLKDATLLSFDATDFLKLQSDSEIGKVLLGNLLRKLRMLTQKIQCLTTCTPENRFYAFIIEQYGMGEEVYITISKKEVASAIGATPETLSRLLSRLVRDNGVIVEGKKIVFPKGFWDDVDFGSCTKEW